MERRACGAGRSARPPRVPPAEAFLAAHRDCRTALDEAAHTSEVFIDQFDLLHSHWMGHVVDLYRDPTYQALLDEAVACLVARGWKTDSYEGFFSTVDGQISRAAPDLEAMRQISRGAGRDFSDCLVTWDGTRTTQLETDRAAFVDDNFAALVEAEAVFRQFFGDAPHERLAATPGCSKASLSTSTQRPIGRHRGTQWRWPEATGT